MEPPTKMIYTRMGRTGLKVSRLGFGNWLTSDDPKAQEKMSSMVK